MCLIFIALNHHPNYPLIVAANRDEFFHRPTQALHYWESGVIAGKDLSAGGTWLGASKRGQFAALTNFRDPRQQVDNPISRGRLVSNFLESTQSPTDYLHQIAAQGSQYDGFNLLVGMQDSIWYFSNRSTQAPINLEAGIYGLSNHLLDTPWPKVEEGKKDFEHCINQHETTPEPAFIETLFEVMNHREKANDHRLPNTGVGIEMERYLSPRFIHTPAGQYGTRCSTVLLKDRSGKLSLHERTWNTDGKIVDTVKFSAHPEI